MTQDRISRPSRRSLLAWSGAGALTAATVSLGTGTASAATYPSPGSALLVPSARLDLNSASENWIREKATRDVTIIQSFGYDNANGHIYLAQVTQGGLQLAGESAPVSSVDRNRRGDLTITKWDMSGNTLGYMYLRGFGHGMSIGVEPVGSKAYLWTEADGKEVPDPVHPDDPDKRTSRGTCLARFPFTNGQVLDTTSSTLAKYKPVPGSDTYTASIDPVYGRLAIRYHDTDGVMKFQVHDLDLARLNVWSEPLATVSEPRLTAIPGWPLTTYGDPFLQGYAVVGQYLYMLHGNSYGSTQKINGQETVISAPGVGNTFISCVNLITGAFAPAPPTPFNQNVNPAFTAAAYSLEYREPEGLGVLVPNPAQPGVFSIGMGFASGPGPRLASIYGKAGLIQPS
ncbi:teichoic acid biosynthesis protein C [Streptomyces sp. NBC_00876]|uniref:phage baseplate protein n=1 Tax=Streptomyces sp. NBC_00876 TaxID=2975853 RepID=UPI00386C93C6|nr:teichoic acid biosynthesis protein C [Streptomyces sp. NBC_00876]